MEELASNILELLCRLSASRTHPVTVGALSYFVPELPHICSQEAPASFSGLAELLRCFPALFSIIDDSELVYVNDEKALVYFFLQEQFTLARKNRLSAQFLIESCIQRFAGSSFNTAATCLNESAIFSIVDWKTVRLTCADTVSWSLYKEVTVSRFFEYLLVKLGCTETRSWDLATLETYLLECSTASHDTDLLKLFEHHRAIFEVKHSENGTTVSLKRTTEAFSNAVVVSYFRKYLFGRMAYVQALAIPLEVLSTEAISKAPMEVQCYFRCDEKLDVLRKLFKVHSALFGMTEDDKVYLALYPFEDQMDNLRGTLCYFYSLLYTLSIYGHVCVCYNVLLNCLQGAPSSMRLFLDLHHPNLALIDLFQSMTEFFNTSLRPNCVAPVITCKLADSYVEAIGINELEALAVQRFASLLWVAPQGLRIEILELCLNDICNEVKEYCKERYPDGLLEFFLRYPGIFSFHVKTKVVQLALSLPKFSSVQYTDCHRHFTEDAEITKVSTEHKSYGDLSALVKDVNVGSCPLAGFELFGALLGRLDCFKLQDGKVILAVCNDLNLLLAKFDSRLNDLAEAFAGIGTPSKPKLFKGATDAEVAGCLNNDNTLAPVELKGVSDLLPADSSPRSSSEDQHAIAGCSNRTLSPGATQLQSAAETNFLLMEGALKTTPDSFQALFRKHYPDGVAGFYRKHSHLFEQAEDGTVFLSHKYFPGSDVEDMLHLLPGPDDNAVYENEEDTQQATLPHNITVESVPSPLPRCSTNTSMNLDMLRQVQNSSMQVKEYIADLLMSSRKGWRSDRMTKLLNMREPTLLTFCEQHYHNGLLGFFKSHNSEYDILKSPKQAICTIKLHKNAHRHSTHLVRSGGKISQVYDSSGTIYCGENQTLLHFPAWCFLQEMQRVVSNLKSMLKKGDYVDFQALVNDVGRMTVLTVAKPGKRVASEARKATFECRVILAGPYYSLLEPLRVCSSSGYTPPLKDVTVFSSDPDACLREGQLVRAEVHFGYPSRKLWQTLKLLHASGTEDEMLCPTESRPSDRTRRGDRGQKAWSSLAMSLQGSKETAHQAIEYFARAIVRAGNNVPLDTLCGVLNDAPKSVQDFCRQNFHEGLVSFFRRFTHVFKVTPDRKVTSFLQGINATSETATAQTGPPALFAKGNGAVQEVDSQSSGTSEFSESAVSRTSEIALGNVSLCDTVMLQGPSNLPESYILRGLFGTVTGLWEAGVQITSDGLPKPVEASPSSFVQASGTVCTVMTSEWHLGDIVEFDAVCSPLRAVPYLTCAFRVTDKSMRDAVVPVVHTCEVNLVTTYYVLMTLCMSWRTPPTMTKRVVVILSCPEKTLLTPMQKVTVEVRPGYPSLHFWKADRLLDPQPH